MPQPLHPRAPVDAAQRAAEAPRGRDANAPRQIPARGLRDVLWRVRHRMRDDNVPMIAAAVSFYALLGLFPAVLALVSLYGAVTTPEQAQAQVQALARTLPPEAQAVLMHQIEGVTRQPLTSLGWSAIAGLVGSLFAASHGTASLVKAVGIAYEEEDTRGFAKRRGLAVGLTFGAILGLLTTLSAIALLPTALAALELSAATQSSLYFLRWPILALLVSVGLAVLYAVAPDRRRARWQWVTWGSGLATLLWIATSMGFSFFVRHVTFFTETYGTVAGMIVLMLWLFLSALVVLLGAEVNAELEAQTAQDSTIGPERPMGQRGARKADSLGCAKPDN